MSQILDKLLFEIRYLEGRHTRIHTDTHKLIQYTVHTKDRVTMRVSRVIVEPGYSVVVRDSCNTHVTHADTFPTG